MWPTNQDASKAPPAAIGIPVKLPPPNQSYNNQIPQQQSHLQNVHEAPWSTDLFDCFSDVPNCCITFWCPCITFGQIAEIVDKGSTSCAASGALYALISGLTGCSFVYSCFYRSKLRQQYGLQESPCDDCLVHLCCESCALCQEYRELQHRGFDMYIGWHANMKRQNQGVAMAPPTAPAMSREGDLRPLVLSGADDNI